MAIVKKKVVEALLAQTLQIPTALNSHKINPALPALQPVLAPKVVAVQVQQRAIASQLVQVVPVEVPATVKPAQVTVERVQVTVKLGRAAEEALLPKRAVEPEPRLEVALLPELEAVLQPKQAVSVQVREGTALVSEVVGMELLRKRRLVEAGMEWRVVVRVG